MPNKSHDHIVKISLWILSVILLTSGILLICSVNWKVLIGVLFLIWGNNIDLNNKFQKKQEESHD
jgi:hypothetical protein